MHSRIPLSVVFDAPGQRHGVAHATYVVDADDAFARYLDSNDTRLPRHAALDARACDAAAYDTYTGEDNWHATPVAATTATACRARDDDDDDIDDMRDDGSARRFDDVVAWVLRVLRDEAWAADGVVLCGRYTVADDCTWAAASRSPTLCSVREVFAVMRSSCKFCADIHAQRRDAQRQRSSSSSSSSSSCVVELTLAKALAGPAAKEMRVLLPYMLRARTRRSDNNNDNNDDDDNNNNNNSDDSASGGGGADAATWTAMPLYDYVGVTQRVTEVCVPALMTWSRSAHHDNFVAMQQRVRQAQLLPRACASDAHFVTRLVQRWCRRQQRRRQSSHTRDAACTEEEMMPPPSRLWLLLAVDVLFESATLPIYVLSAKCRVYAPDDDDSDDDTTAAVAASATRAPLLRAHTARGDSDDSDDSNDDDDDDAVTTTATSAAADVGFFRLFRDVANWNAYVTHTRARLRQTPQQQHDDDDDDDDSSSDARRGGAAVQRYCVVAHESSDLAVSNDALVKRGLPLELTQPELLLRQLRASGNGDNEAAVAMLQRLRDTLLQPPQQ